MTPTHPEPLLAVLVNGLVLLAGVFALLYLSARREMNEYWRRFGEAIKDSRER